MADLPNEMLSNIFSFFSQRYISKCATVCKAWFIETRQPQHYKTITLYSKNQFNKFMEVATNIKITKWNIPIGEFVHEVYLHEDCYEGLLFQRIVFDLYFCCPKIKKINGTETYACCPMLDKKIGTDTFFYMRENTYPISFKNGRIFFHQQRHNFKSLNYAINYDNNQYDIIQTQTDPQKNLLQFSVYLENEVRFKKVIYFSSDSSWIQLKELCLSFGEFNKVYYTAIYEFDECIFETICSNCPQLESLTMDSFAMCTSIFTSHQFKAQTISTLNNKTIQPHYSLKRLSFKACYIEYFFFSYFNKMYPSITDLNLGLYWGRNDSDDYYENYRLALFNMMTGFTSLKKLTSELVSFHQFDAEMAQGHVTLYCTKLWPNDRFYEWLKDHPNQLEILETPFDFTALQNNNNSIVNATKSRSISLPPQDNHYKYEMYENLAFLRHLTALSMFMPTMDSNQGLIYNLRSINLNVIVSSSITSLTIHIPIEVIQCFKSAYYNTKSYYSNIFYMDDWLDAFPKLKKLDINHPFNVNLLNLSKRGIDPQQQQQLKPVYLLEELKMQYVYISISMNHLKELLKSCPLLRVLSFVNVNFQHTTTINTTIPLSSLSSSSLTTTTSEEIEISKELNCIIIDVPHLNLDKLELFNIDRYGCIKNYNQHIQKILKVNEIGLKNSFQHVITSRSNPPLNIIVNCKSIDVIHFKDD